MRTHASIYNKKHNVLLLTVNKLLRGRYLGCRSYSSEHAPRPQGTGHHGCAGGLDPSPHQLGQLQLGDTLEDLVARTQTLLTTYQLGARSVQEISNWGLAVLTERYRVCSDELLTLETWAKGKEHTISFCWSKRIYSSLANAENELFSKLVLQRQGSSLIFPYRANKCSISILSHGIFII